MTKTDIIAALESCEFTDLKEIRAAADAKIEDAKQAFMTQAQAMGLSCSDGNGKPRKRRANAKHAEQDNG